MIVHYHTQMQFRIKTQQYCDKKIHVNMIIDFCYSLLKSFE